MEVLDSSSLGKARKQLAGGSYTCQLPMDLKLGSGSIGKSKNESDIRLLQACKSQLSSEVIKWKTECLRLQKERDTERLKTEAKEQLVHNYARQMLKLQQHLSAAEDENKRLREKPSCMPYVSALEKLSTSLDKFHSYPWADARGTSSANPAKKSLPAQEDWREVSQQLLEKMKQEMRELQELGCSVSVREGSVEPSSTSPKEVPHAEQKVDTEGLDQVVESTLTGLISETVSLKQSLQKQNSQLRLLLRKANDVKQCKQDFQKKVQSQNPEPSGSTSTGPGSSTKQKPSRLSDDSFREFFTKQLEGCQNAEKPGSSQQSTDLKPSRVPDTSRCPQKQSSSNSVKPSRDKNIPDHEKVCPICQKSFGKSVPQAEFEEHVLDHLEVESASLLDQYVVL